MKVIEYTKAELDETYSCILSSICYDLEKFIKTDDFHMFISSLVTALIHYKAKDIIDSCSNSFNKNIIIKTINDFDYERGWAPVTFPKLSEDGTIKYQGSMCLDDERIDFSLKLKLEFESIKEKFVTIESFDL